MNSSLAISQVSKGRQESRRYCDENQDKSCDDGYEMEVPVPNQSFNRTKDESCNYTKTSPGEQPSPHKNIGDGLMVGPQFQGCNISEVSFIAK